MIEGGGGALNKSIAAGNDGGGIIEGIDGGGPLNKLFAAGN